MHCCAAIIYLEKAPCVPTERHLPTIIVYPCDVPDGTLTS
jgi:hypothetical protein